MSEELGHQVGLGDASGSLRAPLLKRRGVRLTYTALLIVLTIACVAAISALIHSKPWQKAADRLCEQGLGGDAEPVATDNTTLFKQGTSYTGCMCNMGCSKTYCGCNEGNILVSSDGTVTRVASWSEQGGRRLV